MRVHSSWAFGFRRMRWFRRSFDPWLVERMFLVRCGCICSVWGDKAGKSGLGWRSFCCLRFCRLFPFICATLPVIAASKTRQKSSHTLLICLVKDCICNHIIITIVFLFSVHGFGGWPLRFGLGPAPVAHFGVLVTHAAPYLR